VIAVGSVKRCSVGLIMAVVLLVSLVAAGGASAASPAWLLDSVAQPSVLPPSGSGALVLTATDIGGAPANGSSSKIVLRDKLPNGLTATSASGLIGTLGRFFGGPAECPVASGSEVECTFEGTLAPYEELEVTVAVTVAPTAKSGETNTVSISGGDAAAATTTRSLTVGSGATPFGFANYEIAGLEEDGSIDSQAGSHPFGVTTTIDFNRTAAEPFQPALPKDLDVNSPAGLVGNPTPFPQCTDLQFTTRQEFVNECPADTAIGVANLTVYEPIIFGPLPITLGVPVFNLKPERGEPARFGFLVLEASAILNTSVRTGGDYGVTVSSNNIPQIVPVLSTQVTLWGVPGAASHDPSRGWACVDGGLFVLLGATGSCEASKNVVTPPFLSMPTSCTGPLQSTVLGDAWAHPGSFTAPFEATSQPSLDGCNRLPFEPSIRVASNTREASTPTGLTVNVHVPQQSGLNPKGVAQAEVRNTLVTLPEGVTLNPSGADGLQACPLLTGKAPAQEKLEESKQASGINLETKWPANCPEQSKIARVTVATPLLPQTLQGHIYLAQQGSPGPLGNPFGSLLAMYLVAEDPVSGTLVKLAGEVKANATTGQLESTFLNTPQLPFEDLTIEFFGGNRAPLATPAMCGGSYTTTALFTPWSGTPPVSSSSAFEINEGPNESACSNPLPFSPSLTAGTTSIQAGGFSPLVTTIGREDGQQALQSVTLHMPPGLSGRLTGVKLCGEQQAEVGTCPPESLIGEDTVSAGLGPDPITVSGAKIYLTGPYEGAPFGLSIVNPLKAGPFDLARVLGPVERACDCIVDRAKIEVDPTTAALTVTTDPPGGHHPIPHILAGIPLQLKHVNVTVNRPGFTFNPTNCSPMAITGTITSVGGASSNVSTPFQVTNCAVLGFKPGFKVSTSAKTSRKTGASLDVTLTYPNEGMGKYANIKSVKVDLPKQLPSRLSTLQKACPAHTFEEGPAKCPADSQVGSAKAITPIIPVPLEGPAYFVSHGGQKFPELIVVLKGYGVTVELHGETFINKAGITSSTFRQVPDVPVGSFELKLPSGPNSALAATTKLCKSKLKMPTAFNAQNGLVIHQSTKIAVTGCPKAGNPRKARHRGK
jgi:hypothetical protein